MTNASQLYHIFYQYHKGLPINKNDYLCNSFTYSIAKIDYPFPKKSLFKVNGKFENSRFFEEIRFVIILFQFADWHKKAGIFKLLKDPIPS